MTDQPHNPIARELREAEALEAELTRLFASLQPPLGAASRLLAKLGADQAGFHESELTLDDAGPYSFAQHAEQQARDNDAPDVLAAGLEESPIEDEEHDRD